MNQQERENEMIRGKLETLRSLPTRYTPSMQSKWELLEAGLPGHQASKIRIFYRWVGAAAAILLIGMGFFWAWLPPAEPPLAQASPVERAPVLRTLPPSARPLSNPIARNLAPKIKIAPRPKTAHQAIRQRTAAQPVVSSEATALETRELSVPLATDTLPSVVMAPKTTLHRRVKPKRFTEIDFNDGDTNIRAAEHPFPVAKAKESNIQFRIRINSNRESRPENADSPLKLRYPR